MLKSKKDIVYKHPPMVGKYQENSSRDSETEFLTLSKSEQDRILREDEERWKKINTLTKYILEKDYSYKENSNDGFDGYSEAFLVCTKALYPERDVDSYCCCLPLVYEGTPKSCTVRCPNGCIEEHFTDLDTWE